mmetsp:Transcript_69840/g.227222  ORF Transcript_69840/g.227222 Transcript_69840/m.227222 type:complete len:245 (+) Transcript_69840:855-1589(+)
MAPASLMNMLWRAPTATCRILTSAPRRSITGAHCRTFGPWPNAPHAEVPNVYTSPAAVSKTECAWPEADLELTNCTAQCSRMLFTRCGACTCAISLRTPSSMERFEPKPQTWPRAPTMKEATPAASTCTGSQPRSSSMVRIVFRDTCRAAAAGSIPSCPLCGSPKEMTSEPAGEGRALAAGLPERRLSAQTPLGFVLAPGLWLATAPPTAKSCSSSICPGTANSGASSLPLEPVVSDRCRSASF